MIVYIGCFPVGHTEEPGDEHHENDHEGAQGDAQPQPGYITGREENEHGADAPAGEDGSVGVTVNFDPLHKYLLYKMYHNLVLV